MSLRQTLDLPASSRHTGDEGELIGGPPEPTVTVLDDEGGAQTAHLSVPAGALSRAPEAPAFTRILDGPAFARWIARTIEADPALLRRNAATGKRWRAFSVSLQRGLTSLPWNFPTFVPRARVYDWAIDR